MLRGFSAGGANGDMHHYAPSGIDSYPAYRHNMNKNIRRSASPRRTAQLAVAAFSLCAAVAHANNETKRWVHGSWVNVRSTAAADGPVIDHVITNTLVLLRAENGKSCEISWDKGGKTARGFVPCKLLGDRALRLAEVANETYRDGKANPQYSPPRAFWVAPSMDALFWAGAHFGKTLLSQQQQELERGASANPGAPPPKLVRYPVPEFDAMKAVLANGIVAPADRDPPLLTCRQMQEARRAQQPDNTPAVTRGYPEWSYPGLENFPHAYPMASDCRVPELPRLKLPDTKPSLFRNSKELAPGNADIERLGAHFGIVERGRTVGAPKWELDYDAMRYTGAWDIGKYELTLDKPLVEHVIGRTGLVGAYQWTSQVRETPFGPSGTCAEGLRNRRMGKQVLPGYPTIKDALMWFQAPAALPFKKAVVKSRVERVPDSARTDNGIGIKRVAIYEIDLNGDGIPDFVQWDIWGTPEISGPDPLLTLRVVFVNINGEWYPFESDSYGECT